MNWVMVNAPCSCTGTLRRNPEMKYRVDMSMVQQLIERQRQVFANGLRYLRRDGRIVYSTCSVLKWENQDQVAEFCQTHGLRMVDKPLNLLPAAQRNDGFFAATLAFRTEARIQVPHGLPFETSDTTEE